MRKTAFVALALGLGGILAAMACSKSRSQDEGPIIVGNGSMTIDTDGQWEDDGGAWKNVTGKDNKNELWVRVDLTDGTTCKGSGHPVHVEYSAGGFKATFNVAGNPPQTNVAPKGQLNRLTNQRLQHGSSGDGGYINLVRVNNTALNCSITQNNLKSVNICSSPDVSECK